jgi:PAS domain S-box-containing protein
MRELFSHLRAHRFALAAAGIALFGTLVTWPLSQRFPFALFIAAVMVSAWRGGMRPGLVTTGASTAALLLLFLIFPTVPDAEPGEHFLLRLGMFVLVGVLAGYLSMKCKQAIVAHDRFHDTLASLGEALIFTDAHGKVTFLNPIAQTLMGIAPADAEGKPLGQVLTLCQDETHAPLDDPAARTLRENAPSPLPDGTLLVSARRGETAIEGKALPLHDADERLVGVAIAFHTAGERRQNEQDLRQREQRFRVALGASPAALLLLDAQGHCLFTNRACQTLGGFTFDEGLGQGWTRCIDLDDRDRVLNDWTAALQSEAGAFSSEFRLHGTREEPRCLHLRSAQMFSDKGQSLGHVATLEEITELKRAEQARRGSEDRAVAAAQRQEKIEQVLSQLRAELERQVQSGAETQRQAEEKQRALENAKQQAEAKIRDMEMAKRQAEETLNGSQLEFARLMDEHLAAKRQAEEALHQARDEFSRQLDTHAVARREAEEALARLREEPRPESTEHATARRKAEEALAAAHQDHSKEIEQLNADFLNDMNALEEKLAQARHGEDEAKRESESLQREIGALRARLEEEEQAAAQARQIAEELNREKERLETLVRAAAPPPVQEEIATNGHTEPHMVTVSPRRPPEPADWLSYN